MVVIATNESQVLDATRACVARWGVAKTSLDDVAVEAGCSRATVYRLFPGGKGAVTSALLHRELGDLLTTVAAHLDRPTMADALTDAIVAAAWWVADHEALGYLLAHEPQAVLRYVMFDGGDWLCSLARAVFGPHLATWLPLTDAMEVADWATRQLISYTLIPSVHVDLTNYASARRLVDTYLVPAYPKATAACP